MTVPHHTYRMLREWAMTYCVLVTVAVVPIAIWCIWHAPDYGETTPLEDRVLGTWLVLLLTGYIPTALVAFLVRENIIRVDEDERGAMARDDMP